MRHIQIFVALVTLSAFLWLALVSWQHPENHGYTKSEIQQHDRLMRRSLKHVELAEANQRMIGELFQIEPDGSPVELYRNGSAVK